MIMRAKYKSWCPVSGQPIFPGDWIVYERGKKAVRANFEDVAIYLRDLDPEAYDADPQAALAAAESVSRVRARPGALTVNSGDGWRTYYRNPRGRCEDAPCCGCCTY